MCESNMVKRGQVYWVQQNVLNDDETSKYRPAVVVSRTDIATNEWHSVTVVFLTTTPRDGDAHPDTWSTGKKSWVLCNTITTISKQSLGTYLCTMTDYEMVKIEDALCRVLGMAPTESVLERENEKLREKHTQLECELKMWQKLYDKTMEQLVDLKFTTDLASRSEKRTRTIPVLRMAPEKMHEEPDDTKEDVKEEKVNINTASAKEINEKTGLSMMVAYGITGYRKRNGLFDSVSDLLKTDRFTEHHMKKYGERFVV